MIFYFKNASFWNRKLTRGKAERSAANRERLESLLTIVDNFQRVKFIITNFQTLKILHLNTTKHSNYEN